MSQGCVVTASEYSKVEERTIVWWLVGGWLTSLTHVLHASPDNFVFSSTSLVLGIDHGGFIYTTETAESYSQSCLSLKADCETFIDTSLAPIRPWSRVTDTHVLPFCRAT